MHIFLLKWLDHLLLITSYPVTIATNSHQTSVIMCLGNMPRATEMAGVDDNTSNCFKINFKEGRQFWWRLIVQRYCVNTII